MRAYAATIVDGVQIGLPSSKAPCPVSIQRPGQELLRHMHTQRKHGRRSSTPKHIVSVDAGHDEQQQMTKCKYLGLTSRIWPRRSNLNGHLRSQRSTECLLRRRPPEDTGSTGTQCEQTNTRRPHSVVVISRGSPPERGWTVGRLEPGASCGQSPADGPELHR